MSAQPGEAEGLYATLLGARFEALAPAVRRLHVRQGVRIYDGEVEVTRGAGALSTLCAWASRLPRPMRGAIRVRIDARGGAETWTRMFGAHAMRSRLTARDGLLHERLGLLSFAFRLTVHGGSVLWHVVRVSALGLPLPAAWFAGVCARESECEGRYHFDVAAALPRAGLLVAYRGWLHVG